MRNESSDAASDKTGHGKRGNCIRIVAPIHLIAKYIVESSQNVDSPSPHSVKRDVDVKLASAYNDGVAKTLCIFAFKFSLSKNRGFRCQ